MGTLDSNRQAEGRSNAQGVLPLYFLVSELVVDCRNLVFCIRQSRHAPPAISLLRPNSGSCVNHESGQCLILVNIWGMFGEGGRRAPRRAVVRAIWLRARSYHTCEAATAAF